MQPSFSVKRLIGELVERAVDDLIRRTGVHVIRSFDWSGKDDSTAPTMIGPDGKRSTLPDLQCFRDGRFYWLEVKWKRDRTPHWASGGTLCTGINKRLWDEYRAIQERTGSKVFLLFVHGDTQEMRGDAIDALDRYKHHPYDGPKMGRDGMWFWEYDRIPRWGSLTTIDSPWTESAYPSCAAADCRPLVATRPKSPQTDFFDALEPPKRASGGKR